MTKVVLTTKVDPTYDDLPEIRYHFPKTYLRQAEAAKGDWIVYYEPRRSSGDLSSSGGRQGYFATAHLDRITNDQKRDDHFYAHVSNYLEFPELVPFKEGDLYYEGKLRREDGGTNKGRFGRSVRAISDSEYDLIVKRGFTEILDPAMSANGGVSDEPGTFERPIIERVVARPFRDAAFASAVKAAYANTCAVTGLRIINGGGRAEVQAAHIRPVADLGPDSVRNGLALCGTAHWMFDRGLISVADDYSLLVCKDKVPDPILARLLNEDHKLLLSRTPADKRPHHQFLKYHRDRIFKG